MAKRKNDDGRGAVYLANDGTQHPTAKARDAYENRGALAAWLTVAATNDGLHEFGESDEAVKRQIEALESDTATFLTLLRNAGIRAPRGSRVAAARAA